MPEPEAWTPPQNEARWIPTQRYAELCIESAEGKTWNVHGNVHNLAKGYIAALEALREIRLLADPFLDTSLWGGHKRASGDRLDDILLTVELALPEDDRAVLEWLTSVVHI